MLAALTGWSSQAQPVRADDPVVRDHRDPAAHLEIVIRNIIIHDDQEYGGDGSFEFSTVVGAVDPGCDPGGTSGLVPVWILSWGSCMSDEYVRGATIKFSASDFDTHRVSHTLPSAGDKVMAPAVIGQGFPVMENRFYGFEISGKEIDLLSDDDMGSVVFPMLPQNEWGRGVHTVRGYRATDITDIGLGGNDFGNAPAEFSVEFEVRRVAAPDLVTALLGLRRLDDGRDAACMTAVNAGPLTSGPFDVSLKVDGAPVAAGTSQWASLDSGQQREQCVVDGLPSGRHLLSFDIDLGREILELDERNNHLDALVTITAPAPIVIDRTSGGPASVAPEESAAPSTGLRDLIVEKVLTRGKKPASGSDCDPGENDVIVTVKNQGTSSTGAFFVRLLVDSDDDDAQELPSAGLAAGATSELKFEEVKMKKGEHVLTITADVRGAVAETNELNNSVTNTVRCANEDD